MQNMINIENLREIVKKKRDSLKNHNLLPELFLSICDVPCPDDRGSITGDKYAYNWRVVEVGNISDIIDVVLNNTWATGAYFDGHRHHSSFIGSRFAALDFDKKITIKEVDDQCAKCGLFYVIAPTLSHQKEKLSGKKTEPPCDRFRLILKFDRLITDFKEYQYNIGRLIRYTCSDSSGSDSARCFYKSSDIYSFSDGDSITAQTIPENYYKNIERMYNNKISKTIQTGILPDYIKLFLYEGVAFHEGVRHKSIISTAFFLKSVGYSMEETFQAINSSPFDRSRINNQKDISEEEIINAIKWSYNNKEE
jgi:hypothetical protein